MYERFVLGIAILIAKDNKILLTKRNENKDFAPGIWEIPSGRCETGETIDTCLKREAKEELSIDIRSYEIIDAYTFMRGDHPLVLLTYLCQYLGDISISDEHSQMRWVNPKEAIDLLLFNPQKATIRKFIENFAQT